jgi:hypothetical protein
MRHFSKDFQPIQVSIQDVHGKIHELETSVRFTPSITEKVEELVKKNQEGHLSSTKMVVDQMTLFFNKDIKFWNNFELSILGEVLEYVA